MSHAGAKWKIIELHGEMGRPVTATMVAVHGDKEKRAWIDELAKLAATMPVHICFLRYVRRDHLLCGLTQKTDVAVEVLWYARRTCLSTGPQSPTANRTHCYCLRFSFC